MIAFFDLDKTLIKENSATRWIRAELRSGHISYWQALRATVWLVRYHLGAVALENAIAETIRSLRGTSEKALETRVQRFYENEIKDLYRPGARRAVAKHRARGERVVLLTSTSPYLSRPVAHDLQLDDYLCTRFEVAEDGTFTGDALSPLCFAGGKVTLAENYAAAHEADLAQCSFYSDSASDIPMLERVGYPVVVAPDPKLRRIADERRWPIENWD